MPEPRSRGRRSAHPWADGLFGIGLVAVAALGLGLAGLLIAFVLTLLA